MAQGASINDQIMRLLQETREETRRTAYEAGYRDALRDQAAAREILPTQVSPTAIPLPSESVTPPLEPQDINQSRRQRAPWGTSSKAAGIAFERAGDHGVTLEMVCQIARDELGYEIAESSARSILNDMRKRKQIRSGRGGRWFRRPPEPVAQNTVARAGENDRATEDSNNGGQRWNHPDDLLRSPRVTDLRPETPEDRAMREVPEAPTRMVG